MTPPAPVIGEQVPIYRNGEPVHVDASGYLLTPSSAAYGTLPGRMKLHRGPNGELEITSERSGFAANLINTLLLAGALSAIPAIIACFVRTDLMQLIMIGVATVIAAMVLVIGLLGSLSPRGPLHAFNPLVRWDPREQLLTFDAGRVKIAQHEVRAIVPEKRWIRWYRHNSANTLVKALWIKVDEGEYAVLPLSPFPSANHTIVTELVTQLPFAATTR